MARDDNFSQAQIDSLIQKLEKRIDVLKKRYRRYFLGIEQTPPRAMRKQVVREIFELEHAFISNTAQKFKLRSVVQSFNTHKTRWNRIMRQIEEGTYKRDVSRAERRQRKREREAPKQKQEGAFELDDADFIEDIQEIDLDAVFEQPSGREPAVPSNSSRQPASAQRPNSASTPNQTKKDQIKKQKLAEIQRKLGLSGNQSKSSPPQPSSPAAKKSASDGSVRKRKLAAMQRKLNSEQPQRSTPQSSQSNDGPASGPTRSISRSGPSKSGANRTRQNKLQRLKKSLQRDKTKKEPTVQRTKSTPSRSSSPSTGSNRRVVRRSRNKSKDEDSS